MTYTIFVQMLYTLHPLFNYLTEEFSRIDIIDAREIPSSDTAILHDSKILQTM